MKNKKIAVIWISLTIIFTSMVIFMEITPKAKASTIWFVDDVPGGIPSENFTSIQDAINASNDGDTVYVFNGTYFENVVVNKTINLIGENKENTFINGGGNDDVIRITVDWVNVTGFTITNSGTSASNVGIDLTEVQSCTIYGNNITNNSRGIYLYSSNANNINNNYIFENSLPGIHAYYSIKNNIHNNTFFSNMKSTLDQGLSIHLVYSNETSISKNNMIGEGLYISGDLLGNWNTHNIDVSNKLNNRSIYYLKNQTGGIIPLDAGQIILANCTNVIITNHTLMNGYGVIILGFSSYNNISNNYINNNFNGIYLWYSDKNIITGNNVSNNGWGIITYYSKANNINYNILSYNNDGINLIQSNGNNITNNTALNNGEGIHLYYSNDNEIYSNYLSENYFGISVSYSDYNNITNNEIFENYDGVQLSKSGWNKIIGNIISYNLGYGVEYLYAANIWENRIYHNNFIGNTIQAEDGFPFPYYNHWDNGYPDGGNFWSDYSGNDDFNGPDQNISGNDDIGDSWYTFKENAFDRYPLMSPFGDYIFLYQGWNLISLPFIQPDTNLTIILNSIEGSYDAIQRYNSIDFNDQCKHNNINKPTHLNDLDNIDHTMGLWIHITEPGGILFQYPGIKPIENQTINIYPGWNLVGYPSLSNRNRTNALNNIDFGSDVDAIWTHNATTQKWKEITASDNFEVGMGYWIHSKVTKTWEVPL